MRNLYITGNGFDIHHGINSRYSDYREWLKEYDFDLYDKLCRLYDSIDEDDVWWNSFEQHLSAISFDYINRVYQDYGPIYGSEDFCDADNHRSSIQVELDLDIDDFIETIGQSFKVWVNSLNKPNCGKLRIEDKDECYFLTFNYTKTLEDVYNIPSTQICHIHGSINGDDLIWGHGETTNDIYESLKGKPKLLPKDLTDEQYEDWLDANTDDPIMESIIEASANQLSRMRKNVFGIIRQNHRLFESLKDVRKIYILGFAFSPIDIPYLEEVLHNIDADKVLWIATVHTASDEKNINQFIDEHNLDTQKWCITKMDALNIYKEQVLEFNKLCNIH